MSSVKDSLRVYRNPFSKATTNAKIPDGKAVSSAGVKKIWTRSFALDEQPYNILLYPGLQGGMYMELGDPTGNLSFNGSNKWADDQGAYTTTGGADPVAGQGAILQREKYINKWRLVSQGMRISSTAGTVNNGGWWEAVRIPLPTGQDNYVIASSGVGFLNGADPLMILPNANLNITTWRGTDGMSAWGMTRPMNDNPTYQTGAMKDLDNLIFKNKPIDTSHPFCSPKDHYAFTAGFNSATAQVSGVHSMRTEDTPSIVTDLIDHSFDAVLIRIHPLDGQQLLVHLEANHELIYAENEPERVHHSVSPANQAMLGKAQQGHVDLVAPGALQIVDGVSTHKRQKIVDVMNVSDDESL